MFFRKKPKNIMEDYSNLSDRSSLRIVTDTFEFKELGQVSYKDVNLNLHDRGLLLEIQDQQDAFLSFSYELGFTFKRKCYQIEHYFSAIDTTSSPRFYEDYYYVSHSEDRNKNVAYRNISALRGWAVFRLYQELGLHFPNYHKVLEKIGMSHLTQLTDPMVIIVQTDYI